MCMSKETKITLRVTDDQFRLMRGAIHEIINKRTSLLSIVNENPGIILSEESLQADISLAKSVLKMLDNKCKDWPF